MLSTVFNLARVPPGPAQLLLVKNYKSSQAGAAGAAGGKGGWARRGPGGPGLRAQPPRPGRAGPAGPAGAEAAAAAQRGLPSRLREESDFAAPGTARASRRTTRSPTSTWASSTRLTRRAWRCAAGGTRRWSWYAPRTPDLNASYPYCCRPSCEAARPWEPGRAC